MPDSYFTSKLLELEDVIIENMQTSITENVTKIHKNFVLHFLFFWIETSPFYKVNSSFFSIYGWPNAVYAKFQKQEQR